MDREGVLNDILSVKSPNILCELPTSFGKSKIAIEILKKRNIKKVLIVVPRNVLKENWRLELLKWNYKGCVEMTTYISFPKYNGEWDAVVFDECHHISERCRESLRNLKIKTSILLSATVSNDLKDNLIKYFPNLYCYKITAKQAIDSRVLPNPRVYLLPLELDNAMPSEFLIVNPKGSPTVDLPYAGIWQARSKKGIKFRIACTQRQYYNELSSLINWYKKKAMGGNQFIKNKWLHECGVRLRWLSNLKNELLYRVLLKFKNCRTLVFCNGIEQTEVLSQNCINSKNSKSDLILRNFNSKRINHITACNALNEGINLVDCQVGIYGNLNSSQTIIAQRLGRLLRHPNPIIIIPYYKNTREEELKDKMLENYNPELIQTINSLEDIKI